MNVKTIKTLWLFIVLWTLAFQLPVYGQTGGSATSLSMATEAAASTPPGTITEQPEQVVSITGTPQVVVVSGSNYEMGYQYGQQAAPLIYQNKLLLTKLMNEIFGKTTTANDIKVWTYFLEKYNPKLKDWLNGISAGCKSKRYTVSYSDLVVNMVYMEELWARSSDPYPVATRVKAKNPKTVNGIPHMCSSFGATNTATPDGKPIIAQTAITEQESMGFVILVAFPTDGYSFITFPHAGAVAWNQGANSKGFAFTMDAAASTHPIWGLDSLSAIHYLTQYCASSAEAQNYIESTPRGGVTGLFIFADGNPAKMYALEANGQKTVVRNPGELGETDFLNHANDFRSSAMQDWNIPGYYDPDYPRFWTTYMHLVPVASTSGVDVDFVKSVWKSPDWYSKTEAAWHYNDPLSPYVPGNSFGVGGQTQFIYLPASNTVYLQFGSPSGSGWPAYATGEYTKFQLLSTIPQLIDQVQSDALTYYVAALNKYLTMKNAKALDPILIQSLNEKLGVAFSAWSDALASEAEAYWAAKKNDQMASYGEAVTGYSKAQLYSQMVTTELDAIEAAAAKATAKAKTQ